MELGIMRFNGVSIHHNPHTIIVSDKTDFSEQHLLTGKSLVFNGGVNALTVSGEGVFYGEDAFEQYLNLREIYKKNQSGLLSIGGINPFFAYIKKLEMKSVPIDDYIEYTFEFIETESKWKENKTSKNFTIAKEGEDLWDISYRENISVDLLLSNNKNIKNTCDVKTGDRINLW